MTKESQPERFSAFNPSMLSPTLIISHFCLLSVNQSEALENEHKDQDK